MNKKVLVKLTGPEENTEINTKCVFNSKTNEVKYIEEDELKTIVKFNFNDYILTRKNDNMRLRYHFDLGKVTEGELIVSDLNTKIKLNVETISLKHEDNKVDIEFLVENDKFNYILEVK